MQMESNDSSQLRPYKEPDPRMTNDQPPTREILPTLLRLYFHEYAISQPLGLPYFPIPIVDLVSDYLLLSTPVIGSRDFKFQHYYLAANQAQARSKGVTMDDTDYFVDSFPYQLDVAENGYPVASEEIYHDLTVIGECDGSCEGRGELIDLGERFPQRRLWTTFADKSRDEIRLEDYRSMSEAELDGSLCGPEVEVLDEWDRRRRIDETHWSLFISRTLSQDWGIDEAMDLRRFITDFFTQLTLPASLDQEYEQQQQRLKATSATRSDTILYAPTIQEMYAADPSANQINTPYAIISPTNRLYSFQLNLCDLYSLGASSRVVCYFGYGRLGDSTDAFLEKDLGPARGSASLVVRIEYVPNKRLWQLSTVPSSTTTKTESKKLFSHPVDSSPIFSCQYEPSVTEYGPPYIVAKYRWLVNGSLIYETTGQEGYNYPKIYLSSRLNLKLKHQSGPNPSPMSLATTTFPKSCDEAVAQTQAPLSRLDPPSNPVGCYGGSTIIQPPAQSGAPPPWLSIQPATYNFTSFGSGAAAPVNGPSSVQQSTQSTFLSVQSNSPSTPGSGTEKPTHPPWLSFQPPRCNFAFGSGATPVIGPSVVQPTQSTFAMQPTLLPTPSTSSINFSTNGVSSAFGPSSSTNKPTASAVPSVNDGNDEEYEKMSGPDPPTDLTREGIEPNPGPVSAASVLVPSELSTTCVKSQTLFLDGLLSIFSWLTLSDLLPALHSCHYWYACGVKERSRQLEYDWNSLESEFTNFIQSPLRFHVHSMIAFIFKNTVSITQIKQLTHIRTFQCVFNEETRFNKPLPSSFIYPTSLITLKIDWTHRCRSDRLRQSLLDVLPTAAPQLIQFEFSYSRTTSEHPFHFDFAPLSRLPSLKTLLLELPDPLTIHDQQVCANLPLTKFICPSKLFNETHPPDWTILHSESILMRSIREWHWGDWIPTDGDWSHLATHPPTHLRSLKLRYAFTQPMSSACLAALQITNLTLVVYVNNVKQPQANHYGQLLSQIPSLTSLTLDDPWLADEELRFILTHLNLTELCISPNSFKFLQSLKFLPPHTTLNQLAVETFQHLTSHLSQSKHLRVLHIRHLFVREDLSFCELLTDQLGQLNQFCDSKAMSHVQQVAIDVVNNRIKMFKYKRSSINTHPPTPKSNEVCSIEWNQLLPTQLEETIFLG